MKEGTLIGLLVIGVYLLPLLISIVLEITEKSGGVPYMRNPPKPPVKEHNNYQPTIDNTTQPPK